MRLCSTAIWRPASAEQASGNSGEDSKLLGIPELQEKNLSYYACHCHDTWSISQLKPVSHQGPATLAGKLTFHL